MAFYYPGYQNVYVKSTNTNQKVTANLVINYGRDPKKLLMNQYISVVPVSHMMGKYRRIAAGQAWKSALGTVQGTTGLALTNNGFQWPIGQASPKGDANKFPTELADYSCQRYRFPTNLDMPEIDMADYEIEAVSYNGIATQAATNRMRVVIGTALDTTAYPNTHVSTSTALVGNYLDQSTLATRLVQKAITKIVTRIMLDTGSAILSADDIFVVMNPNTAGALAATEEFASTVIQQVDAIKLLQGDAPNDARAFGLPYKIYGARVFIDTTVENTTIDMTPANLTSGNQFVFPDGQILVVSRPGGIEWAPGSVNPCTIGLFEYEAFTAEEWTNEKDRLIEMAVTENFDVQVVAPLSGYVLTNVLTPP